MPSPRLLPGSLGTCVLGLLAGAVPTLLAANTHARQEAPDVSACKLPAVPNVYLSSGFGFGEDCAPSTGALNAFMLFVDFPDQEATDTPEELYDFFVPGASDWYATSSYGKLELNVTADLSGFYRSKWALRQGLS